MNSLVKHTNTSSICKTLRVTAFYTWAASQIRQHISMNTLMHLSMNTPTHFMDGIGTVRAVTL